MILQDDNMHPIKLASGMRRRWACLGLDMNASRDTQVMNEWCQDACFYQLFCLCRGSCLFDEMIVANEMKVGVRTSALHLVPSRPVVP